MERLDPDPRRFCKKCRVENDYTVDLFEDIKAGVIGCKFAYFYKNFFISSGTDSAVFKHENNKNVIKIYPYLDSKKVTLYSNEIDRVSQELSGKRKLVGRNYNFVFVPIDNIVTNEFGNGCTMVISRNIEFPNFTEYRREHPSTPDLLIPIENMFTKYYKKRALTISRKLTRRFDLNDMNFKLDDKTNTIYFTDIASSISVFLHIYVGI